MKNNNPARISDVLGVNQTLQVVKSDNNTRLTNIKRYESYTSHNKHSASQAEIIK